jgi:hypothetical protein
VLGRFLSTEGPQLTLGTQLLFVDITGPTDEANPWRFSIFDREGSLIASESASIPEGLGSRDDAAGRLRIGRGCVAAQTTGRRTYRRLIADESERIDRHHRYHHCTSAARSGGVPPW